MKPITFLLFFCIVSFRLLAQEKGIIVNDTIHKCYIFTADGPSNFDKIKIVDSLLKLKNDTTLLRVACVGDYSIEWKYDILYRKDGIWRYDNSYNMHFRNPTKIPTEYSDSIRLITGKYVFILSTDIGRSSGVEDYHYFVIVRGVIVTSLSLANHISIKKVPQHTEIDKEIAFFNGFDNYLTKIYRSRNSHELR